ncbi:hypothetical protein ACLK1Y_11220 [Escherichia coli]
MLIDSHRITADDMVTVGRDAWAAGNPVFDGSSLMFLKAGDRLSVRDRATAYLSIIRQRCLRGAGGLRGGRPTAVREDDERLRAETESARYPL